MRVKRWSSPVVVVAVDEEQLPDPRRPKLSARQRPRRRGAALGSAESNGQGTGLRESGAGWR